MSSQLAAGFILGVAIAVIAFMAGIEWQKWQSIREDSTSLIRCLLKENQEYQDIIDKGKM